MFNSLRAFSAAASLLLAANAPAGNPQEIERAIDPAHSRAAFSVTHLYVNKVTGTVPILGGKVIQAPGNVVPISISATLDARRVDTHDEDRNESLQGPDWFDTKRFPEWTFNSSVITTTGADAFTVDGTVTIHGVTQPVKLTVTVTGTEARPVYQAQGSLDRHAFGMRVTPLDGTIGNDLVIDIQAALKPT